MNIINKDKVIYLSYVDTEDTIGIDICNKQKGFIYEWSKLYNNDFIYINCKSIYELYNYLKNDSLLKDNKLYIYIRCHTIINSLNKVEFFIKNVNKQFLTSDCFWNYIYPCKSNNIVIFLETCYAQGFIKNDNWSNLNKKICILVTSPINEQSFELKNESGLMTTYLFNKFKNPLLYSIVEIGNSINQKRSSLNLITYQSIYSNYSINNYYFFNLSDDSSLLKTYLNIHPLNFNKIIPLQNLNGIISMIPKPPQSIEDVKR